MEATWGQGSDVEVCRQQAVDRTGIVALPRNSQLQQVVEAAAKIANSPLAAITIIDRDRQWFAARVGIIADETPRTHSFCAHGILSPGQPMIVWDAREDPRFSANPLVSGEPGIRFYAGIPLVDDAGYGLGALCVTDSKPRGEIPYIHELVHLARQAERIICREQSWLAS
jgi:GAF domain-containing protein